MIFGSPSIHPKDLARNIQTRFNRMTKKLLSGDDTAGKRTTRTNAVKILLRKLATERSFHVYPNSDKRFKKPKAQWLVDLVWWNDRQGRLELVVECEWNTERSAVLDDFEKLLAMKSPLKLMIYRSRPKTKDQVQKDIGKCLQEYGQHVDGESYIMCEFQRDCYCYLFRVEGSNRGRVKDVRFRTLFEA